MSVDRDILDTIFKRFDSLERRLDGIENNAAPTIPIYDETQFPIDAVEGQVALTNSGAVYKYQGGIWAPIGGLNYQHARFTATPYTVNAGFNTPHMAITAQSYGPTSLIDWTTDPTTPTVLASGVYVLACDFRQVIALGGTGTQDNCFQAALNALSSILGYTAAGTFEYANPSVGYLPQITLETIPVEMTAGDGFSMVIKNCDTSSRVFDSPYIDVVRLS